MKQLCVLLMRVCSRCSLTCLIDTHGWPAKKKALCNASCCYIATGGYGVRGAQTFIDRGKGKAVVLRPQAHQPGSHIIHQATRHTHGLDSCCSSPALHSVRNR